MKSTHRTQTHFGIFWKATEYVQGEGGRTFGRNVQLPSTTRKNAPSQEIPVECMRSAANRNSLHSRRHYISQSFIQDICDPSSCIHHLLPPTRDTSVLSRLRSVTPLPRLTVLKMLLYYIRIKSTQLTPKSSPPYIVSFLHYILLF